MTLRNNGLYIDRLSMNFGGLVVFEDVSIEIPPGKVTACIGPNGAGKTTIINIVCGVFPPKAGDIYVDGERLGGLFLPRARAEERANRDHARRLLQAVALDSAAERPAGELPFGQQKLLSLLRAVATDARVLLL